MSCFWGIKSWIVRDIKDRWFLVADKFVGMCMYFSQFEFVEMINFLFCWYRYTACVGVFHLESSLTWSNVFLIVSVAYFIYRLSVRCVIGQDIPHSLSWQFPWMMVFFAKQNPFIFVRSCLLIVVLVSLSERDFLCHWIQNHFSFCLLFVSGHLILYRVP